MPKLMGSQEPTFKHRSRKAVDFRDSEKIIRFGRAYMPGGGVPDPWQEGVLYDSMARDKNGFLVHKSTGLLCPRQNGKGVIIELRSLYGAVILNEAVLVTSHHMGTTKSTFARIVAYLENPDTPELTDQVKFIRRANGQESIEFIGGGSITFAARTKAGPRGRSFHTILLDESQEMSQEAYAALLPTIASKKDGSVFLIGTPDTGTSDSEVFNNLRATALKKKSLSLLWFEWSADPEADPSDILVWAMCNPALGRRLTETNIQAEFDSMPERDFMIERLGTVFSAKGAAVIPEDLWMKNVDDSSQPVYDLVLALDISPNRSLGTISIAGRREDDLVHVEVIEQRLDGIAWVVPRLKELVERHGVRTLIIDGKGPAASLEEQLKKIRGLRVQKMNYTDVATACGLFYDAVLEGHLKHISQPNLNMAVQNGRKRNLGDAWAWSRSHAGADITALVSATNAFWACQSSKVRKKKSGTSGTAQKRRVLVF